VPSSYRESLGRVAEAVENLSPSGFTWFGRRRGSLPGRVRRWLSAEVLKEYVQETLTEELYHNYYTRGFARPGKDDQSEWAIHMGITPFLRRLIECNVGSGTIEHGWVIDERDGKKAVVTRHDGLKLWISDFEHIVSSEPADQGVRVALRLPKHLLGRSPGYYVALGDKPLPAEANIPLTRIYCNIGVTSAGPLVKILTRVLNAEKIPFCLKVLSEPSRFGRGDSAVLYTRRADFEIIRMVIWRTISTPKMFFENSTPAFTKRLAPGIGVAEDPGDGRSFGQHRCGLIAQALIEAAANNAQSREDKIVYVDKAFKSCELDLDAPFLGPGAVDLYRPIQAKSFKTASRPYKALSPRTYLDQATSIGRSIVKDAVWHQSQCNWVGASPPEKVSGVRGITYVALGPDLYNGSSGIGLFLGELGSVTGDRDVVRTAIAALRRSLLFDRSRIERGYWGAFTGWTGIALAAARCGTALGSDELITLTREYVQSATMDVASGAELDVMSGLAGGLVALLALQRYLPMGELNELVDRFGEILLTSAVCANGGKCWSTLPNRGDNLTGLAHGASGIGFALMELHRSTDDGCLRSTALQAFDYERAWLDRKEGNWCDLQRVPLEDKRFKSGKRFSTSWCSGATGIALTRLAAWQLFQDEICRSDAIIALHAVQRTIETGISAGSENFSLCHGLAGNAEAFLQAGSSGVKNATDARRLAESVADYGIEQYSQGNLSRSCGCAGRTPGLMLGLAGFGHFYLRMYSAAIPSPMLIGGQTWTSAYPKPQQQRTAGNGRQSVTV
jgi:hypothetical protein